MPVFVFALTLFVASLAPARAQTTLPASVGWETTIGEPDIRPVQVRLTSERIERFLASLRPVLGFARHIASAGADRAIDYDLALLLTPHLLNLETEAEANSLVSEFGFASYADWANTSHSISLVLEAADITGSLDLASQEQAALRDVERNTKLSADEKARALEELKSQFSALAEFEPLPGNREVAAPYIDSLRAAIGR